MERQAIMGTYVLHEHAFPCNNGFVNVIGYVQVLSAQQRRTLRLIAELNAEGVPTVHGGATWHPETVRKVAA
jgi:hypothetical protein